MTIKTQLKTRQFSSVQLLSHVWLFVTPWTVARQASMPITNSWNLFKLMSIESVIHKSSHPVFPFSSHLQSFPASGSFPMSQFLASCGQSIGVSASASVLPMNVQDWFPLGWAGWISLLSFIQFCPLENINKYRLSTRIAKFHGDSLGTRAGWSKSPEECLWNSFSRWGWCRCFCMDALRCSKCPILCSNPDPSPTV